VKKKFLIMILSVVFAIWLFWGNVTVGVTRYTVASPNLPSAFEHYKIAVVSDLHNAEFGKRNSWLISLVEQEKPDMIAITGDMVDSSKPDMEVAERLAQKLIGIAPCYYVTGNHEAWIGEQYRELEKKLLDAGVAVLRDRSVMLTKNNESIELAGLDDPDFTDIDSSGQESRLKTRLRDMRLSGGYRILLSHRPEDFSVYVSENVDLVLSGHTHGGQIRLPFVGGLIAPNQGFSRSTTPAHTLKTIQP
jgi:predicted MPP superfamily phosphohydrolase